jgi:hypothetical protein
VFRAALAGLLTLGCAGAGLAAAPAAPAAAAEDADPLVVHIDTISPELPRNGDVEITGTVTNVSDETFTRINLHAFSAQAPMLDAATLQAALTVPPSEFVGQRVTEPGTFDTVDTLAPGQTASFTDTVPVELLGTTGQPGVYWIGIHALGDSSVPRDDIADGRARTFIPMRPTGNRTQEASVVLPVRHRIWYARDGSVAGTERWAARLEEGGSLDGVLDMAESAGTTPYSWLVDPAVLVALSRLANGNGPRTLAPDPATLPEPTTTEEPEEAAPEDPDTASPTESLSPTQPEPTEEPSEEEAALAVAASDWLLRFKALVGTSQVLVLPYGDLDVSAAVRNDATRYDQALGRSAEVMGAMGISARFAIAPASDVLSAEALARTPIGAVVLLGDNAFAIPPERSVVRLLDREVVVTSTGAEAGGPGPTAANDPLALRQRLLSEAAIRLIDGQEAPLVVTLPTVWRGEDADSFFTDLEQSWLEVVPVEEVADGPATDVPTSSLVYNDEDQAEELDPSNFAVANRASGKATLLEQVLTQQTLVENQVRDEVLVSLSEQHRERPRLGRAAATRVDEALQAELDKVSIEVPPAVTLSSDSGPLGVTLVNGLDQPVSVRIQLATDGNMTVTGGDGVRALGPRARSVVRFEASTTQAGVHNLRLAVTSADGVPLGSSAQLPIRAARVSALIWIVMVVGALVLFGMIGYRLPGQIRQRRAELAAGDAGPGTAPATELAAGDVDSADLEGTTAERP